MATAVPSPVEGSWHLWLSAGRGPVGAIGVLHQILFDRWCERYKDESLAFTFPASYDLQDEKISIRPWLKEALNSSSQVWEKLIAGELVTPFLLYAPPKRDWRRSRASPGLGTDIGQLLRADL